MENKLKTKIGWNWDGFNTYEYRDGKVANNVDAAKAGETNHITSYKYSGELRTEKEESRRRLDISKLINVYLPIRTLRNPTMKYILTLLILLIAGVTFAQSGTEKDSTISNPNYDPVLAEKLGADDYGMKSYLLVILKTGPNQSTDKTFINNSFRGHLENINRLVEEGKMIVAGPLGKNDQSYRGIFILNVPTFEEAEKLLQNDPAVKEGLLDVDLYHWYGSAALSEYLEFSDKVWKVKP